MESLKKTSSIYDDYSISKHVLGVGISGKVLTCMKKATRETFALKILKRKPRCINEIELHLKVSKDCPYIVKIVDIYDNEVDGVRVLLVIMELMPGGQLFDAIKNSNKQFTEKKVAKIMLQICKAVKHLHDMNIAHRDLKPENLLLSSSDDDAVIKLIDFGFAKDASQGLLSPCFTPYYVSPEILKEEKYDKSCDIWSLGVIMYILCCGYPPFYSLSGHPISPGMENNIKYGNYDFPKSEWSIITDDAKSLIQRMLETLPAKRINIDEVLNDQWLIKNTSIGAVVATPAAKSDVALASPVLMKKGQNEWEHEICTALEKMRVQSDTLSETTRVQSKALNFNEKENKLFKKRAEKNNQEKNQLKK